MTSGYTTFAAARATQAAELGRVVRRLEEQLSSAGGRLTGPGPIFVGIGASHAAAAPAVWKLRERGVHAWRQSAGDLPVPYPTSSHPVVGVSQSGRSAETLAVLDALPTARRLAVVNVVPSPISDRADLSIGLGNLTDSYASTVGYTATVAALGMLAECWDGGRIDDGWFELEREVRESEDALAEIVRSLAPLFATACSADFVGAGPSVGSAEAAALLFREVARIPSTGMSTRQYLHGAMESAGDGVHVVFGGEREADLAATLAGQGHHMILVSEKDVPARDTLHPVRLAPMPPARRAVLEVVIAQTLVAAVADVRGVDVEEFVFHNPDTKVSTGSEAV